MADLESEEPISNLSDSSFVIFGHGSLPGLSSLSSCKEPSLSSLTNNKGPLPGFESSNMISSSMGEKLNGSVLSEEGIQKKLNELVKENYQLKETLSQNNLAIKSQLDTFFLWQQEVLKTHETHKQKFLETKELILKLRAENTSLKKQLEDSLGCTNYENDVGIYAEVNKKPQDLDKLQERVKKYETIHDDLITENKNLKMEIVKQNEELHTAKKEILKLNNELEDLGRDNAYLKQENDDYKKNSVESRSSRSLPNSEARAQISNLLKQLDEEKSKVFKLKEELKKIKLSNGEAPASKLSTTDELNQYIDKLTDMDASLDMQNQRFSSLQSWVSLAEETLKETKTHTGVECNLMCEINELKSHLNQEENVSRVKHESLQELRQKYTTLLDNYKALQLKLSALHNGEAHVKKCNEELSSLSAKLEAKDNELRSKEQECHTLKEEIKKLNLICEEVHLLKIQAEVYQSDFHDERAAREKLADEKEAMAEQVRHLQSKIQKLEQDHPKKKDDSEKTPPLESPGKSTRVRCPKCNFAYSDMDTCMEHFEECCNILFYP